MDRNNKSLECVIKLFVSYPYYCESIAKRDLVAIKSGDTTFVCQTKPRSSFHGVFESISELFFFPTKMWLILIE